MRRLLLLLVLIWSLSLALVNLGRVLGKTVFDHQTILQYMYQRDCYLLSLRSQRAVQLPTPGQAFPVASEFNIWLSPDQQLGLMLIPGGYEVINLQGEALDQHLVPADYRVGSVYWMGDSRGVIYVYIPLETPIADVTLSRIVLADITSGEMIELGTYNNIGAAYPAPQGDWLLLLNTTDSIYLSMVDAGSTVLNWRTGKTYEVGEILKYSYSTWGWSPDGQWLAFEDSLTDEPRRLNLLNVITGERVALPVEMPFIFGWSPDSRFLLAAESSAVPAVAWLVDLQTPEDALPIELPRQPLLISWSPDSQKAFLRHQNSLNHQTSISLLSAETGSLISVIDLPPARYFSSINWLEDSQHLLSMQEQRMGQTEIKLLNIDGQLIQTWQANQSGIHSARFIDPDTGDFQAACRD